MSMYRVHITAIEDPGEQPYTLIWDVQEAATRLILSFGTGAWREMRVIGESDEALNGFRRILKAGGYSVTSQPKEFTLFQPGDECWAWFVYIDPTPKPLP